MALLVVISLFILFIISFYLAFRSLSELEIPPNVLNDIKIGKTPPRFWGVIIFLKGKKEVHYSSSSDSTSSSDGFSNAVFGEPSSKSSDNKSERMDV